MILYISTYKDTKTTTQTNHKVQGPISWYFSIEHYKMNKCCSTCPNKIVTSKKVTDLYQNIIDPPGEPSGPIPWYRSIELDRLNNFALHIFTKYLPVICNWNIYIIDTKLTLQASQKSHGWYYSIDRDKLNNFCSRCLYKIFNRKKLLPSKNIDRKSTLQASHMSRGSNSWYRSIELDKLNNFCLCFKMF